jgi:hypothetical protein
MFKKLGYVLVKNAIPLEIINFLYSYFLLKKEVAKTFYAKKYIPPISPEWGTLQGDEQIPDSVYAMYGDIAMDLLLSKIKPTLENIINIKLYPTYSYARIYQTGNELFPHVDRYSCDISGTVFLGGDKWPIYLLSKEKKEIEVNLELGDILIYKGDKLKHWRKKFTGGHCAQVFLHYNNQKTKLAEENIYDKRPHLGLPPSFQKK